MRTRAHFAALVTALAGCAAPIDAPTRDLKESYVEAPRGTAVVKLVPYPLSPQEEDRAYVAVRDFVSGRGEGQRKLGRLLAPEEEEAPAAKGKPTKGKPTKDAPTKDALKKDAPKKDAPKKDAPTKDAPTKDAPTKDAPTKGKPGVVKAPNRRTPSLLLFPEKVSNRRLSACYLGHSAYARRNYSPLVEVVHHLRLLIVNRETGSLRVPVKGLTLEPALAADEEQKPTKATGLKRLVATNARGERLDTLVIPPEGDRVLHVFFTTRKLLPSLLVRWEAERAGPVAPGQRRVWTFSVSLTRRYIIREGIVSALERKVALGAPLPPASPEPGPWSEPRISPVGR